MINQVCLVGRVAKAIEVNKDKNYCIVTLSIPRPFKNNGEYKCDFVDVVCYDGIANKVCEYLKTNDLMGVKGKLELSAEDYNNGKLMVRAEKVTFLDTMKEGENNE